MEAAWSASTDGRQCAPLPTASTWERHSSLPTWAHRRALGAGYAGQIVKLSEISPCPRLS